MGPSSVADNHLVALGDDVLYGHLNIGEGGTERRNEQLDAVGAHDVRAAALQFVRKVSGYRTPSRANEEAFNSAVEAIAAASRRLLDSLKTR